MLLSSPVFLLFLLIVSFLYFVLPKIFQKWIILSASIAFYCFNVPQYLPLLLFTVLWTFWFGKTIARKNTIRQRKIVTAIGVAGIAGLFIFFRVFAKSFGLWLSKYTLLSLYLSSNGVSSTIIWPVGISFYSLSLIGYLIDICDEKIPCEIDFFSFVNYAVFFPTILSGPINKASKLLPQFKESHSWSYSNTVTGLRRFLVGAVKKLVLADGISLIVNGVWENLNDFHGLSLIITMLLYSIQLYGDFSGYSDMALGTARILGFEIEENFTAPFMAQSFSELWSRWHNSLSGWLKTYVYFPLGGSRKGYARKILNIFIVFLVSGLWHGAGATFIVWGLLTSLIRVADELIHSRRNAYTESKSIISWINRLGVFLIFSILFVYFRATNINDAMIFFKNLFTRASFATVIEQIKWLPTRDIADGTFYSVLYWGGLVFGMVLTVWSDLFVYNNPGCPDSMLSRVKSSSARMFLYWISGIIIMLFYFIQYTKNSGSVSFIYAGF